MLKFKTIVIELFYNSIRFLKMSDSMKKKIENVSCNNSKNSNDCNINRKTNKKLENDLIKIRDIDKKISLKNRSIVQDNTTKETATDDSSKISESTKNVDGLDRVEQNYSNRLESLQLKLKTDTDFLLDFSKYDNTKSAS